MMFFVTGGTGFIGGRVTRRLLEQGHAVHALVRSAPAAAGLAEAGARLFEGDVTDARSVREAMAGADGVFHIAAWYKVGARDARAAEAINAGGTRVVLEAMRDLAIPKGVYTSTLAVHSDTRGRLVDEGYRCDGPWLSEYDKTKWIAHYEVAAPMQRAGLPLVIVMPGLNYGPGDTSTVRATLIDYLRRKLAILPARSAYCWAHVDDTARGHLLAMERGRAGESYHIAGPPHTLIEAFAIAERLTGIPAPKRHASPQLLRAAAALAGVFERFLPIRETYRAESLRVLAGVTYLGTSAKAEAELGFRARPLEEGLRETLAHEMRLLGLA